MSELRQEVLLIYSQPLVEQSYILTVDSETEINERKETQKIERCMTVKISYNESLKFKAEITSVLNKLQLGSLYKKQEVLSEKMAALTESVDLRINKKGELLKILNHQVIIEKWRQLKRDLEKEYKGENAAEYFKAIDRRITKHDSLLQNFKELKSFGLIWFAPCTNYHRDTDYTTIRVIENLVYIFPIAIHETLTLSFFDKQEIKINISGSLSKEQKYENRIKDYLQEQSNKEEAIFNLDSYTGYCTYNRKTGVINELELEIKSSYGSGYKKTQRYRLIKNLG